MTAHNYQKGYWNRRKVTKIDPNPTPTKFNIITGTRPDERKKKRQQAGA